MFEGMLVSRVLGRSLRHLLVGGHEVLADALGNAERRVAVRGGHHGPMLFVAD